MSRVLASAFVFACAAALAQETRPVDLRAEIVAAEAQLAAKDAAGAAARLAEAIRAGKPQGEIARVAHRMLARALVDLGKHREAVEPILESFGLDASAAPALALAARGSAERGERRAARALLAVAVRLDPARKDLVVAGAALALEDGDSQAALRDAEVLLGAAPADVPARVLRARALHALGHAPEARDALAALDRAAPLEPALLRVLGGLDLETGLLAEAEAAWSRTGALATADAEALARAWLDRGDAAQALRVLGAAQPGEAPALQRLRAAVHLARGDGPSARAVLAALPEPGPDDLVALARAERLSGRLAEAAKILEAVLARDAGVHAARSELVDVRMVQGDAAAARRLLREGLVLAPHHAAFVQALDDLVPELARGEAVAIEASLSASRFEVGGIVIGLADPAAALAALRPLRTAAGARPPAVRLVLTGVLDAAVLARASDLLAAAGFSRVGLEAR